MKTARLVILVITSTIVTACTSGGGFVSVDQKFGRDKTASGFHLVREGETLYSIAWRYGLDYRELANANSISSPHTIYPGQKIDIDYTAAEAAREAADAAAAAAAGKDQEWGVVLNCWCCLLWFLLKEHRVVGTMVP